MSINNHWKPRPKSLSERGYRKYMARTKEIIENGMEYTLQSVSPSWYLDNLDRYSGKKSYKYMDQLIKNVVVSPPEVATKGMAYFEENEDLGGAASLISEIETFLGAPAGKQGNSPAAGKSSAPA